MQTYACARDEDSVEAALCGTKWSNSNLIEIGNYHLELQEPELHKDDDDEEN